MRLSLFGLLLGATVVRGQAVPDSGQVYEIQGRVVDADTGSGVSRARVSVTFSGAGAQSTPRGGAIVLLTDPSGTFRLTNIPSGFANLFCERNGYFAPDFPHPATAGVPLANRKDTTGARDPVFPGSEPPSYTA